MIENLKNRTTDFIERYIEILEKDGDPDESYKYQAINTFQSNWNTEAEDFHQMLRDSLRDVSNLLYQNSWGFINKSAEHFPEEVREMFRRLYDETVDISERIKRFQDDSKKLLTRVKDKLNLKKFSDQQDERTISVYLAFRYPEKHILYKADYYLKFCELLNIDARKTGERYMHLQELADQIITEGLLNHTKFLDTYRNLYSKPDWDDKYLMIQNVLYVVFAYDYNDEKFDAILKKFDKHQLLEYYTFFDDIIEKFGFKRNDKRLVFNAYSKEIVITFGQRYIWNALIGDKEDNRFRAISEKPISKQYGKFNGSPEAYLCKISDLSEAQNNKQAIFNSITKEIGRTNISGYHKYNKKEWELMAFDKEYRHAKLGEIPDVPISGEEQDMVELTNYPLNQILYGAPGTGKTYKTKQIAVEIINGKKERSRKEINNEYEELLQAKKVLFTTFHQSLSYEDFIEGIKPMTVEGRVTYEVKDGIFKRFCLHAKQGEPRQIGSDLNDPSDRESSKEITGRYVFIIDEINRGNVSAIFGELITLLEEDKRKGNDEKIEVMLPYSKLGFTVPNNVYILGTMNTADRSVEALDTALRRRFSFIEMQPDPNVITDSEYRDVNLKRLLEVINLRIEALIDKDHQIGHSYFIGIRDLDDLKQTFKDNIIPLLEEYFYGDFGKIGLVLGGSFIRQEENRVHFPKNFTYDNDFPEDKKIYRYTPFNDWNEQTFNSVYEEKIDAE
jgi:Cdc6-like AAA superfamily ATPase